MKLNLKVVNQGGASLKSGVEVFVVTQEKQLCNLNITIYVYLRIVCSAARNITENVNYTYKYINAHENKINLYRQLLGYNVKEYSTKEHYIFRFKCLNSIRFKQWMLWLI